MRRRVAARPKIEPLTDARRKEILDAAHAMAARALRVLGLADYRDGVRRAQARRDRT